MEHPRTRNYSSLKFSKKTEINSEYSIKQSIKHWKAAAGVDSMKKPPNLHLQYQWASQVHVQKIFSYIRNFSWSTICSSIGRFDITSLIHKLYQWRSESQQKYNEMISKSSIFSDFEVLLSFSSDEDKELIQRREWFNWRKGKLIPEIRQ